jgi:uncharacterized cupredoxin-like copper-binding protein
VKAIAAITGAVLLLAGVVLALEVGRDRPTGAIRQMVIEDMRYSPNRIDLKVGETVTLQIVNRGAMQHDVHFASLHMPELAGAQSILEPGESRTLRLRFDAPGTHTFSCSHPGHAGAGMTGAVFVSP